MHFISDKEISMKNLLFTKAILAAFLLVFVPAVYAADQPESTTEQILQVDLNTANAESIANALDGIGMVKAQEIVAYREMFGNFRSVDELAEVRGVGMATVERNRHKIVILAE